MTALDRAFRIGFQATLGASGISATRYPAGSPDAAVTVRGDFIERYERVNPLTLEVIGVSPALDVETDVDPAHAQGDYYTINGTTYYVNGLEDDGVGVTKLILSKDTQVPVAPSRLSVALTLGQAVLTWNRNAANNVAVEVWSDPDGEGYVRLATLAAGVTTYTDESGAVAQGYKLRNTNKSGPSPFTHRFSTAVWALIDESGNVISDEDSNIIGASA